MHRIVPHWIGCAKGIFLNSSLSVPNQGTAAAHCVCFSKQKSDSWPKQAEDVARQGAEKMRYSREPEVGMDRRDFVALGAIGGFGTLLPATEAQQSAASVMPPASGTMILTREDAHIYKFRLNEAQVLVDGARSGGAWWMGRFREDPGFVTTLHLHPKTDEQFYVLEGVLSMYLDGKWHDLLPGTLALVPHGTPHSQGNHSKAPVHFLGSGSPSGFEGLFPDMQELLKRMKPDDPNFAAEMVKIGSRNDMTILGPPPPRS
jgi:quercetin dioxygenase-like cupin family protein